MVWWLIFFMVLPFGAAPEEHPQPGNVESAPARPRLLLKALITTVLAAARHLGHSLVHRQRPGRPAAPVSAVAYPAGAVQSINNRCRKSKRDILNSL